MTDETTRIPVPTNGHGPMPGGVGGVGGGPVTGSAGAASSSDAAVAADGPTPDSAVPHNPRSVPPGVAAGTDLRIAVSPAQIATGFAVLAGLIGLIVGARRRRRR
jgi:hypothetical protein